MDKCLSACAGSNGSEPATTETKVETDHVKPTPGMPALDSPPHAAVPLVAAPAAGPACHAEDQAEDQAEGRAEGRAEGLALGHAEDHAEAVPVELVRGAEASAVPKHHGLELDADAECGAVVLGVGPAGPAGDDGAGAAASTPRCGARGGVLAVRVLRAKRLQRAVAAANTIASPWPSAHTADGSTAYPWRHSASAAA